MPSKKKAAPAKEVSVLGDIDVETFLRDYWQKKPLLIRGGLPGFVGFLDKDGIFAQCEDERTPSRFVTRVGDDVEVQTGPFGVDEDMLPDEGWTVLVSSIETVFDEGWALLDRFSFLPRARVDDLMVSYAATGGGVGPHFDVYDVFLVQGFGTRRWRIGHTPVDIEANDFGSTLVPDFEPDEVIDTEAGDILYLPPRIVHDGVALTPCSTWSVGGAAPSYEALIGEFFAFLALEHQREGRYADENPAPTSARGVIPAHLVDVTEDLLRGISWDRDLVTTFLGRLLTGPKPHTVFEEPDEDLSFEDLKARLQKKGTLRLSPPSRMLHQGGTVFMNGEAFDVDESDAAFFGELSDRRAATLPARLTEDSLTLLCDLWDAGFIRFA